jgi:hypothetical protein
VYSAPEHGVIAIVAVDGERLTVVGIDRTPERGNWSKPRPVRLGSDWGVALSIAFGSDPPNMWDEIWVPVQGKLAHGRIPTRNGDPDATQHMYRADEAHYESSGDGFLLHGESRWSTDPYEPPAKTQKWTQRILLSDEGLVTEKRKPSGPVVLVPDSGAPRQ